MLYHSLNILHGIVCVGLFFTSSIFTKSNAGELIIFDNFSEQVTLIKRLSSYYVEGTDYEVVLSNRLVVKTTVDVVKEDLYQFHKQVIQVKEIFKGFKSHIYLLELEDPDKLSHVLKALRVLQKQDEKSKIQLIQPDILQLKTKAEVTALSDTRLSNKTSPYISLLNLPSLWAKTKGQGVKVAIIDDGFNLKHPDLQHIKPIFSYDADTRKLGASPKLAIDGHGTKVAGIIFAAHNPIGIDGIAPEAEFIALRQPDTWTSNTLLSLQLAKLAGASVINCSWHSNWLLQPVADAVNELAQYGRDGKGIAVVFAAGNQGQEIKADSTEAAINSAIVVAANDRNFNRLNFSNYGQSVDLSVYGRGVKSTLVSGGYGIFAGTSLAAAIVSGLSALLISQYPDMTLKQLTQELKLITQTKQTEVST